MDSPGHARHYFCPLRNCYTQHDPTVSGNIESRDPAQDGNICPTNRVCRNGNCVCATLTNFRKVASSDAGGGTLHFRYLWDSSTGHLNDLANCVFGEKVSYPASSIEVRCTSEAMSGNPTTCKLRGATRPRCLA